MAAYRNQDVWRRDRRRRFPDYLTASDVLQGRWRPGPNTVLTATALPERYGYRHSGRPADRSVGQIDATVPWQVRTAFGRSTTQVDGRASVAGDED